MRAVKGLSIAGILFIKSNATIWMFRRLNPTQELTQLNSAHGLAQIDTAVW